MDYHSAHYSSQTVMHQYYGSQYTSRKTLNSCKSCAYNHDCKTFQEAHQYQHHKSFHTESSSLQDLNQSQNADKISQASDDHGLNPSQLKEMDLRISDLLTKKVFELSNNALETLLKENGLYDDWSSVLREILQECLQPNQFDLSREDCINKNIKIKRVPYKDTSLTRLVKGVVIRKNALNKKGSEQLNETNILMFKGNLEEASFQATMIDAFSMNRENSFFDNVVNKIVKANPQIIITGGTVSKAFQKALAKAGKTIVMRMREGQFMRLVKATKAQPIDEINHISLINSKNLGSCKKFKVIDYENKSYYAEQKTGTGHARESFDPSLIFFEQCRSEKDMTIIISGPDVKKLTIVKDCLKKYLHIMKMMFLEKDIISQEISLFHAQERIWKVLNDSKDEINSNTEKNFLKKLTVGDYYNEQIKYLTPNTCLFNESTVATAGYLLNFATERTPIQRLVKASKTSFTIFNLVPLELNVYPDLAGLGNGAKVKFEEDLRSSDCWEKSRLSQLEKEPHLFESPFWGKDTLTLEKFLKEKALRPFEKCGTCSHAHGSHIQFIVRNNVYVRVETVHLENRRSSFGKGQTTQSESGGILGFFGMRPKVESSDNHPQTTRPRNCSLVSHPSYDSVIMYFECAKCHNKLSKTTKLNKSTLEYPFARYLEFIMHDGQESVNYLVEQREGNVSSTGIKFLNLIKNASRPSNIKPCCLYSPKNRVFKLNDIYIKFKMGYSNPLSLKRVDYRNSEADMLAKTAEESLIGTKQAKLENLRKSYFTVLADCIKRTLGQLTVTDNSNVLSKVMTSKDLAVTTKNIQVSYYNNTLLQNLDILHKRILNIVQEIDNNLLKKPDHHLELDKLTLELYGKISTITESLRNSKEEFLRNVAGIFCNSPIDVKVKAKRESDEVYKLAAGRVNSDSQSTSSEDQGSESDFKEKEILLRSLSPPYKPIHEIKTLKYNEILVFEDQIPSFVAYVLNSPQYMKEIYKEEGFIEYEQYVHIPHEQQTTDFSKFMNSKLMICKLNVAKHFVTKIPPAESNMKFSSQATSFLQKDSSAQSYKDRVDSEVIQTIDQLIEAGSHVLTKDSYLGKIRNSKYQVTCYYPVQFEALRAYNGIDLKDYLSSLSSSKTWEDNTGGKTGARFTKTDDQRFVFKEIEKKEFNMLLEFIRNYFKYVWEDNLKNPRSLLVKIYGTYEINDGKKSRYFIAMENLFFGVGQDIKVYDLKGSELNRYYPKKQGEKRTLLDTNYKVDRNAEPLPIRAEDYSIIYKGIRKDTDFLATYDKIDYSLLLIYDEKKGIVRMGIIDYLRNYDFEKQLEHVGKLIIKGKTPTVVGPEEYEDRFKKAARKYLMPVYH